MYVCNVVGPFQQEDEKLRLRHMVDTFTGDLGAPVGLLSTTLLKTTGQEILCICLYMYIYIYMAMCH